jgi:hypothetical protein
MQLLGYFDFKFLSSSFVFAIHAPKGIIIETAREKNGGSDGTRTRNTQIDSLVL